VSVTFLTGASGFLGLHLVKALMGRGEQVRALLLPEESKPELEQAQVEICRGDVRRAETLNEPMRGVDTVFHLAAVHGLWRPPQDYYDINVSGTENVCRAASAAGVRRFVHVSTWVAYGMALGQPLREELPLRPFSDIYAVTKARGDMLVQDYISRDHLPAVIVRPGTLFGPGDEVNFGRMADRLRAGKAVIIGSGGNSIPFVYVTNVVDGLLLAAGKEQAVGQTYNLADDSPLTQEQMWRAMAEEIGVKPPRRRVPYHPLYALAFLAERAAPAHARGRQPLVTRLGVKLFGADNRIAIEKARRELGYQPQVSVREGVRRSAAWYLGRRTPPAGEDSQATLRRKSI
jgi:nucleoside-diphosphate-sugar epimerase